MPIDLGALAGVDVGLPIYGRSWAAPDEPLRRSRGEPLPLRGQHPDLDHRNQNRILAVADCLAPSLTGVAIGCLVWADRQVVGPVAVSLRYQRLGGRSLMYLLASLEPPAVDVPSLPRGCRRRGQRKVWAC
jgi:hypothetical protein